MDGFTRYLYQNFTVPAGDKRMSHTRLADNKSKKSGGKWFIPDDKLSEFYDVYSKLNDNIVDRLKRDIEMIILVLLLLILT